MFQRDTRLWVVLTLAFTANTLLLSQNQPVSVSITGTTHREPMNVFPGQTTLTLCGLVPGKTYQVIATPAYPEQTASFRLTLADPALENKAKAKSPASRPQLRRFVAKGKCVQFAVDCTADQPKAEVPMFLSASCMDCMEAPALVSTLAEAAKLVVTQGNSATDLVTNVLIGGNCFDVTNIKSTGSSPSRGTFSQGQGTLNLSNGVILCTAPTSVLPGPNDLPNVNGGFGNDNTNDPHLATLTSGNQFDVSIIEFDFKPTANMVQFDFVFGSEEYCEYVNTIYNDVFGFFISGPGISGVQNIALLPGGTTPVAINNINHLKNQAFYRNNNNFGTCNGLPTVSLNDIQLDGYTSVLTATANLQACQTYHIKLAIADIGDANYTSAVFLRANSFDAGGKVLANAVYPSSATPYTREGCGNSFVRFYRGTGDASQPLTINYTYAPGGTATPGVDFELLPTSIVIPAGQTEILVPVKIINDQIAEGSEWFRLELDNSCSCDQQDVNFVIQDIAPPLATLPDQLGCAGSATLAPTITGGLPPMTYQWNTGQATPSITVTNFGSSVYSVTVTDVCGYSAIVSATATVDQSPTAILSGIAQFCPGGVGSFPLNFTGNAPWIVGYTANGVSQTQTFTTSPP
ncbi:MAG: choice-of-anchor L domain-containing protein [Saprospiraceae bacterium]